MKYLVHDIETVPESEIAGDWKPAQWEIEKAGGGDPFPPIWAHKVVCIGMLALDANFKPTKGGCAAGGLSGGKTEKEMIERWSSTVSGEAFGTQTLELVDWHGRGFDVPVLQTRAWRYGVDMSWYFKLQPDNRGGISTWSKEYRDRYGGRHMDLADVYNNKGAFQKPHLDSLAKLMGLPGKFGDFDGSMVYDAYKAEEYAKIDRYCMQDVFQTAFVFQRFLLLSGKLQLKKYQEAAQALLDFIKGLEDQADFYAAIDQAAVLLTAE